MSLDATHLNALCREAEAGIDLASIQQSLQRELVAIQNEAALVPFQRIKYSESAEVAIATIERRRADPLELARAIRLHLKKGSPEDSFEAIEAWLCRITEQLKSSQLGTELLTAFTHLVRELVSRYGGQSFADRPELVDEWADRLLHWAEAPVDRELLDGLRTLWSKWPQEKQQKAAKALQDRLERLDLFSRTSPDLEATVADAMGVARLAHALPIEDQVRKEALRRVSIGKCTAEERQRLSLALRVVECLEYLEHRIEEVEQSHSRFARVESFVCQVDIFRLRDLADSTDLTDEQRDEIALRLQTIEERFDSVRFMASTAVFKRVFVPVLERCRGDLDTVIDFRGFQNKLTEILREASTKWNQGKEGIDKISKFHWLEVKDQVQSLRDQLAARRNNLDAMLAELAAVERTLKDLDSSPVLTRRAIVRTQNTLKELQPWCQYLKHEEAAVRLQTYFDACRTLWNNVQQRYQTYVDSVLGSISALQSAIPDVTDLRSLSEELNALDQIIENPENSLHPRDKRNIGAAFYKARDQFYARLNSANEVDQEVFRIEHEIEAAAKRINRSGSFSQIEEAISQLSWRIENGRFHPQTRRGEFRARMRQVSSRFWGLRRHREEYLRRQAENIEKLADHVYSTVQEACEEARQHPERQSSWESLVDADKELSSAPVLRTSPRYHAIKALVDQGFSYVREARARFAREAAIVHAQYMTEISNVLRDLERTEPPPERADALSAIEVIKPLRERLRSEKRLLRGQREDILEHLAIISQSIDEIFNQDAAKRQSHVEEIERQVDLLLKRVNNVSGVDQIGEVIWEHKRLHELLRKTQVSMAARRQILEQLEWLFTQIMETKAKFGPARFNPAHIDETLSRLEQRGLFAWMKAVPRIA